MEWLIVLAFGTVVALFGGLFVYRHRIMISRIDGDEDFSVKDRDFLIGQQKRRVVTSFLVICVGVLIPLTYDATVRQKNVLLATIMMLMMLILIFAIMLLAISDVVASRYLQVDVQLRKAELELKRRMLADEYSSAKTSPESPNRPSADQHE